MSYYAQKAQTLQLRETHLLRASFSNKENAKKKYSQITIIEFFIETKLNFFNQLQDVFSRLIFLIHYDRIRILFIDINAFKKREYEIMICHVKKALANCNKTFSRQIVKLILFLSKVLFVVEHRYCHVMSRQWLKAKPLISIRSSGLTVQSFFTRDSLLRISRINSTRIVVSLYT